jgi:ABC-type glycerol-3-phosphate transport system substrate-binding protein
VKIEEENMRRFVHFWLAALLLLPVASFAAGGQEGKAGGQQGAEEKVVSYFADSKYYVDNTTLTRNQIFEKETGIKIEMQMIPGDPNDFFDKTDIAIMGGDTTDCIRLTNPLEIARSRRRATTRRRCTASS